MGKVRLHCLMKRFNVGLETIVEYLRQNGEELPAPTPNTIVADRFCDLLESHFSGQIESALSEVPVEDSRPVVTRQDEFDARYIECMNEIVALESEMRDMSSACSTDARQKRERLNVMYAARERMEKSERRFASFLNSHPEYRHLAKEADDRRTESDRLRDDRYETVKSLLSSSDPVAGQSVRFVATWSRVVFHNGMLEIIYRDLRIPVKCYGSRREFNSVVKTFMRDLPPIEIDIAAGCVSVVHRSTLDAVMDLLSFYDRLSQYKAGDRSVVMHVREICHLPKSLCSSIYGFSESDYLAYLLECQSEDFSPVPLFGGKGMTPDGFLFTVRCGSGYIVLWEDLDRDKNSGKSTFVFRTSDAEVTSLQQVLFDYACSSVRGKRLGLRCRKEKEFIGFDYVSVKHDRLNSWKERLLAIFDSMAFHPASVPQGYETFWQGMKDGVLRKLREDARYADVCCNDKGSIDAVFCNHVKESYLICPSADRKDFVKEALLAAIMRKQFNVMNDAERIYVIGSRPLTSTQAGDMRIIRNLYGVPLWYRWYDSDNEVLHLPYESMEE